MPTLEERAELIQHAIVISSEATTEEILAGIDAWAKQLRDAIENREDLGPTEEQEEGKRLWRVLTALRGPDSGNHELKSATTAVLRGAVLPNLAWCGDALYVDAREGISSTKLRGAMTAASVRYDGEFHFLSHARLALSVVLDYFTYRR